ncbi:hypothetical protein K3495_g12167 [Podosphaera aphanis]|nr:hypothetical protein K3495_g12167 [Podosphaera aphanis]
MPYYRAIIFIIVGILVSYLPQHFKIITRRTSEGISPFFVLLGTTSGTFALANILTLPASRADIACCSSVGAIECAAGLLGIVQVAAQWLCFSVILILFVIFFPRGPTLTSSSEDLGYTWRTAVVVAIICLLHGLLVATGSTVLLVSFHNFLGPWANFLGIMGAIFAGIQYLPQIWTTWNLGDVGSLSIPTMLIQTPGSFVWSASLGVRLGPEGWSTWGLYLVTGSLQATLLAMGMRSERKKKTFSRHRGGILYRGTPESDDEGGPVGQEPPGLDESTPLLNGKIKNSLRAD